MRRKKEISRKEEVKDCLLSRAREGGIGGAGRGFLGRSGSGGPEFRVGYAESAEFEPPRSCRREKKGVL